jgi:hypothetical protein
MNFTFLYPNGENLKDQSDIHTQDENEPLYSMSEGSEFLDDAIRMKEMPLIYSGGKVDSREARNLSESFM